MCEYCGCQAVASVELLTREHDEALGFVRSATEAIRTGRMEALRNACVDLSLVLGLHTKVEEQALFPALRDDFPDQIDALVAEHEVIESALAEMTGTDELQAGWQQRIANALSLLPQHILKEQDGVFPAALSTLTPEQWEQLDAVRAVGQLTIC